MSRHAYNEICDFHEMESFLPPFSGAARCYCTTSSCKREEKSGKRGKNLHLLAAVHGAGNQIRNHNKRNGEHRQELPEKRLLRFAKEKAEPV